MLNLIQTELMKLRRKKLLLAMFFISVAMPALITYYASNISRTSSYMDSFMDFYKMTLIYMNILILPGVLGILGTMIFTDEYRNDTTKQLAIVPVSKFQLLVSKIAVLFILSIIIMIFTGILTIAGAFAIGGFPDLDYILVVRVFTLCLYSGLLTPIALMPIVLVTVIARKGFVLPVSLNIVYVFLGYAVASSIVGIHPVSSMMKIVWYKNVEGISIGGSLSNCILNMAVTGIICFAASVLVMRRQEY